MQLGDYELRVIGGEAKGKIIKTLRGMEVRPTSDLVREALFAILGPRVEGTVFLDLFAGSGAVGIEALSRGAREAIFVDQSPRCIKILKENLIHTGYEGKSRIYKLDSIRFLGSSRLPPGSVDLVFIDPPYGGDLASKVLNLIDAKGIMTKGGWVIVEHFHKTKLVEFFSNLKFFKERRFGATQLSFYLYHYNQAAQRNKEEE